ncbi:MAG: aldo/keto reductase, partial [Flavobacteriaceae bacterium]
GLVKNIGVSIYGPELLSNLSNVIELDIVQAPFNVFDKRIMTSGWSDRLKERGTKIHTRSIFLQGLLLLEKSKLDRFFLQNWPELFANWFAFQIETGMRAETIALDFGLRQSWIDKIVVGVDSAEQLAQLLTIESSDRYTFSPQISTDDENLLDPSNWRLK